MQGASHILPNRLFLCVVADQHHEYCDKSFPTIEKHKLVNPFGQCVADITDSSISEHLKRCHSLVYYCGDCLFKFNTSLPEKNLGHAKKEHEKECKRKPSPENLEARNGHWLMDRDQYHRFKVVGWRKTHVSDQIFINGEKESLSKRSWRRIRETIFPGSEIELNAEPATSYQTTEDVMAMVERRTSAIMPQLTDIPAPSTGLRQRSRLVPIPPSTTDMSQLSTQFSWETDSLTDPSSHVFSHSGADGHEETYGAEYGNATGPADSLAWVWEEYQGQQSSDSLNGAGGWLPELPPQVLMSSDTGDPQQASYQE
ncbi:unnamed protein product [Fusarium venenatum]|uniref:Uncharacterized protein n=1 Tax=Fusarium venenatum TaxID=56646 RepID=A0A2L2T471_9HYPO|nr:uncharacterized protein FVRRES_12760 [Fusarium venenatum]CEI40069.1 unnamed protein product [Fusarium venenatum]